MALPAQPRPCQGSARHQALLSEAPPTPDHSGHPPPRSPLWAYWRLRGCERGNATAFLGPWGARRGGNGGPLWAGACKERASHSGTSGQGTSSWAPGLGGFLISPCWAKAKSTLVGDRRKDMTEVGAG